MVMQDEQPSISELWNLLRPAYDPVKRDGTVAVSASINTLP